MKIGCSGVVLGLFILGICAMIGCREGCAHSKMITLKTQDSTSIFTDAKMINDSTFVSYPTKKIAVEKDTIVEILPYGWFDENQLKNDEYRLVPSNIVWSIIFLESIIVPIQYCGYYLYEPVKVKAKNSIPNNIIKGTTN